MAQTHEKQELPQRELKRKAILEAAVEVFLGAGFGLASMDTIAQRAGVSKATVYSHFGNKQKLFGAIIKAQCHDLFTPLQTSEIGGNNLELTLRRIADHFIRLIMNEQILALYRVVIAESSRFPEFAHIFYENGPGQTADNFAPYLSEQTERGLLDIADPRRAAEQFFSLLSGHVHIRALLGVESQFGAVDMDKHITSAIATFLRAYRPRS
ncbi:MAG: TetR/AcrR family transcriptional regulator [Alphaproteobacteria bacterium]|nr:TetR/AcrR family transcriptional regulator [Alphaproteobacteria bacterium]